MPERKYYIHDKATGSRRYIDGKPDKRGKHWVFLLDGVIQSPMMEDLDIWSEEQGKKDRRVPKRGAGKTRTQKGTDLPASVRLTLGLNSKGKVLYPDSENAKAWKEAASVLDQQLPNVKKCFGETSSTQLEHYQKLHKALQDGLKVHDYLQKGKG